jgi:hypothetical protein
MPVDKQKSFSAICERLYNAFMPSSTEAHMKLINRRYIRGESVEELYYDIIELWRVSTSQLNRNLDEQTEFLAVLSFFLAAVPSAVSAQLRMNREAMASPDSLLSASRALLAVQSESDVIAAIRGTGFRREGKGKENMFSGSCHRCGDKGHVAADCWSQESVCYWCKVSGHVTSNCPAKRSGKPRKFGNGMPKNALAGKSAAVWSDLPERLSH